MKLPHGGDIWAISRKLGCAPGEIIDFSASVSPLGPSALAEKSIKDSLSLLRAYPDPCAVEFVSALTGYLKVKKENLVVGNGSIELIYLLPRLVKPKRALIVEPAFGEYRKSLELAGCEIESFICEEEDGFALSAEALIPRLRESPAPDILYMANPANPAGALTPPYEVLRILEVCEDIGITFVVDEAFCDFAPKASVTAHVAKSKALVVLRSMTKFFSLAGLRLGAIAGPKDLVNRVIDERVPWSINSLAIAAGTASLKDTDYISKVMAWFAEESAFMAKELAMIEGFKVFPSSANYFMLKLEAGTTTISSLREALLDKKILIRTLTEFVGLGNNFFRIAIRERADNIKLIEGIKEVLRALR